MTWFEKYTDVRGLMKATFYVDNDDVEHTKLLIRKYSSLRFLCNPLKVGDKCEFCLEGNVQDFNDLFSDKVFHKESQPTQSQFPRMWLAFIFLSVIVGLIVTIIIFRQ